MDEKALFLKLWAKENAATRKVLSRIPEGSTYRPDPKSRTAREVAWLIVREEIVLADGLEKGTLEWTEIAVPGTMREILEAYDRHHSGLESRLGAIDSTRWAARVPFVFQGQEIMNETGTTTRGVSSSTSSIIAASCRPTCARWVRRSRRSTDQAQTNRCNDSDRRIARTARARLPSPCGRKKVSGPPSRRSIVRAFR